MSWQLLSVGFSKVDLVSAFLMALETLHANCVEADTILAVSELQWDQAGVVIINGERLAQPGARRHAAGHRRARRVGPRGWAHCEYR